MDPIEKAICQDLEKIPAQPNMGDWLWKYTKWTREVKSRLCRLAKDQEPPFSVYASGCSEADHGEWLYDLCWSVEVKGEGCLIRLPLVAEIEWKPDGPCEGDFQKLLQARAEHRLWVFEAQTPKDIENLFQGYRDAVQRFQGSGTGDRYLFAAVAWKPRQFYFHSHVCP